MRLAEKAGGTAQTRSRSLTSATSWFHRSLFLAGCAWFGFVVWQYAGLLLNLPEQVAWRLEAPATEFYFWQAIVFADLLILCFCSPYLGRLRGPLLSLYAGGSFFILLGWPGDYWIGVGFFLFLIVIWTAGEGARSLFGRLYQRERLSWINGLGLLLALSVPVFVLLLLLRLFVPALAISFLAPFCGFGALELWRASRTRARQARMFLSEISPAGWIILELFWILFALVLTWGVSGEIQSDSVRSHFPLALDMVRSGGLDSHFVEWDRLMPKPVQTWYAASYALAGFEATKWFAALFIPLLFMATFDQFRRMSLGVNAALFGGLVTASCPFLLFLGTSLYIDQAIVFLCAASFFMLFRGSGRDLFVSIALSGLIMGAALQAKYNVLVFGAVWGAAVLVRLIQAYGFRKALVPLLACAAGLILWSSPWYLTTWYRTGNPLFPYLNNFFHSPLLPAGVAIGEEQARFGFDQGIWTWIEFPWLVTFRTGAISSRHDGMLGFYLAGLVPFLVMGGRRLFSSVGALGLIGALMGLGIYVQTANVRYWLAAWPLMLFPLVVAVTSWAPANWRDSKVLAVLGAVAIAAATLLSIPLWTGFNNVGSYPWEAYSQPQKRIAWRESIYPGSSEIEHLNSRLTPSSGVISTTFKPVYMFNSRSYELPFWKLQLLGFAKPAAFKRFLSQNDLSFWVVDFSFADETRWFRDALETDEKYWVPQSIVVASNNTAAFDLRDSQPSHYEIIEQHALSPGDLKNPASGPDESQGEGGLAPGAGIDLQAWTGFPELSVPETAALLVARFELASSDRAPITALMRVEWMNEAGRRTEVIRGVANANLTSPGFQARLFAPIPAEAVKAKIWIGPYRRILEFMEGQVQFLAKAQ